MEYFIGIMKPYSAIIWLNDINTKCPFLVFLFFFIQKLNLPCFEHVFQTVRNYSLKRALWRCLILCKTDIFWCQPWLVKVIWKHFASPQCTIISSVPQADLPIMLLRLVLEFIEKLFQEKLSGYPWNHKIECQLHV